MRKILCLLTLISLIGCTEVGPSHVEVIGSQTTKIYPFEYKGHEYIMFTQGEGQNRALGIVHDPDCSCHTKNYQH